MNIFKQIIEWFVNETSIYVKGLTLPIVLGGFYKVIKFILKKVSDTKDKKDLFPYYSSSIIKDAKKNYIRTKCQNIDPSNEINYKSSFAFSAKEDLLNFFLKRALKIENNDTQFYLILGDSGMGKTTFMLNLLSIYNSIFSIHSKRKKIKLLPLGEKIEDVYKEINKISTPSETVLLLDAFDEIPALDGGNIMPRFYELIEMTKQFRVVVITCRTHFFSSEKEEPFELKIKKYNTDGNDYHTIRKMYISPFDEYDIKKYISKIYKFYERSKKKKAYQIVRNTNDLMVRPMLLSYIKELINSDTDNLNNSFDIYELLILSWFERESKKYEFDVRFDFRFNLIHFTYAIADFIYKNYDTNGLFIPLDEAVRISKLFEINLNEIEIKSRSLLNRNSVGHYKFSHKSFFEFFLAFLAFTERRYDKKNDKQVYTIKYDLKNFDFAKKFIEDIIYSKKPGFRLPLIDEEKQGYNAEHYKKILKAKEKDTKTTLTWISGKSFQLEALN